MVSLSVREQEGALVPPHTQGDLIQIKVNDAVLAMVADADMGSKCPGGWLHGGEGSTRT
jgi:acyl-coenzyme A thioesterase PaaI-like protein